MEKSLEKLWCVALFQMTPNASPQFNTTSGKAAADLYISLISLEKIQETDKSMRNQGEVKSEEKVKLH